MTAQLRVEIKVEAEGDAQLVQHLRGALQDRRGLLVRIAGTLEDFTKEYLLGIAPKRHATAESLGAQPTEHLSESANRIESESDNDGAAILIPRDTGLGRAFYTMEIRPTGGRKFLTIPADDRTYGRRAGEFGDGAFDFEMFGARLAALVWAAGGKAGEVAYWLVPSVTIPQDRKLLPSDDAYLLVTKRAALAWIEDTISREGGTLN